MAAESQPSWIPVDVATCAEGEGLPPLPGKGEGVVQRLPLATPRDASLASPMNGDLPRMPMSLGVTSIQRFGPSTGPRSSRSPSMGGLCPELSVSRWSGRGSNCQWKLTH